MRYLMLFLLMCGVGFSAEVSRWLLVDDLQNGTVVDSSGNTNTGVLKSGVTTINTASKHLGSVKGSVFDFNGVDNRVDILPDPSFNSPDITITAWVNATASARTDEFIIFSYYTTDGPYLLRYDPANNELDWLAGDNVGVVVKTESVTLEGDWHLVSATYNSTTQLMHIYVDNAEVGTGTSNTLGIGSAAANPYIAGNPAFVSDYLLGQMADVRVYDTALSLAEIQAIFTETKTAVEIITSEVGLQSMLAAPSADTIYELTNNGGASGLYNLDQSYSISVSGWGLRTTNPANVAEDVEVNGTASNFSITMNGGGDDFAFGRSDGDRRINFIRCPLIVEPTSEDLTGVYHYCNSGDNDDTGLTVNSTSIHAATVIANFCKFFDNANDGFSAEGSGDGVMTATLNQCESSGHTSDTGDGATNHDNHILYINGGDYHGNTDGVHSVDGSVTTISLGARIHHNFYGVHFGDSGDTESQSTTLESYVVVEDNLINDLFGQGSAVLRIGDTVEVDTSSKILEGTSSIIEFTEFDAPSSVFTGTYRSIYK